MKYAWRHSISIDVKWLIDLAKMNEQYLFYNGGLSAPILA